MDDDPGAIREWRRDGFAVSTDRSRLDLELIHGYLHRAYWSPGVPRDRVVQALRSSLCFGLYEGGAQVGFARVVTDFAALAHLADVFVLRSHRGRGLGAWLVECVLAHPELQTIRAFFLATRDAHDFYRAFGFEAPSDASRLMVRRRDMPWYRPELIDEDA